MGESPDWDYIEVQKVKANRKITLPPDLRSDDEVANFVLDRSELLEHLTPVEGGGQRVVLWYYLMSAGVALLTTADLDKSEYKRWKTSEYIGGNQIVFPQGLNEGYLSYEVTEGDKAVFLAHEEMLEEEPRSVYVLSDDKAYEYLDQAHTDDDDLTETLKQQPAFFGPV